MQTTPPPVDPGVFLRFGEWTMSAVGGALVALVAFRTRLALMDKRHDTQTARLERIERRQMVTLEILADVAKKLGLDSRFSDGVVKFLNEENS